MTGTLTLFHLSDIHFGLEDRDALGAVRAAIVRERLDQIGKADQANIVDRTSAIVRTYLPIGDANLAAVASALSMTPRTMQRELAAWGTSYSRLLAEIRSALARDYLARSGTSVSEVAGLLGFADPTAFSRFVREALGKSPRELKKMLVA